MFNQDLYTNLLQTSCVRPKQTLKQTTYTSYNTVSLERGASFSYFPSSSSSFGQSKQRSFSYIPLSSSISYYVDVSSSSSTIVFMTSSNKVILPGFVQSVQGVYLIESSVLSSYSFKDISYPTRNGLLVVTSTHIFCYCLYLYGDRIVIYDIGLDCPLEEVSYGDDLPTIVSVETIDEVVIVSTKMNVYELVLEKGWFFRTKFYLRNISGDFYKRILFKGFFRKEFPIVSVNVDKDYVVVLRENGKVELLKNLGKCLSKCVKVKQISTDDIILTSNEDICKEDIKNDEISQKLYGSYTEEERMNFIEGTVNDHNGLVDDEVQFCNCKTVSFKCIKEFQLNYDDLIGVSVVERYYKEDSRKFSVKVDLSLPLLIVTTKKKRFLYRGNVFLYELDDLRGDSNFIGDCICISRGPYTFIIQGCLDKSISRSFVTLIRPGYQCKKSLNNEYSENIESFMVNDCIKRVIYADKFKIILESMKSIYTYRIKRIEELIKDSSSIVFKNILSKIDEQILLNLFLKSIEKEYDVTRIEFLFYKTRDYGFIYRYFKEKIGIIKGVFNTNKKKITDRKINLKTNKYSYNEDRYKRKINVKREHIEEENNYVLYQSNNYNEGSMNLNENKYGLSSNNNLNEGSMQNNNDDLNENNYRRASNNNMYGGLMKSNNEDLNENNYRRASNNNMYEGLMKSNFDEVHENNCRRALNNNMYEGLMKNNSNRLYENNYRISSSNNRNKRSVNLFNNNETELFDYNPLHDYENGINYGLSSNNPSLFTSKDLIIIEKIIRDMTKCFNFLQRYRKDGLEKVLLEFENIIDSFEISRLVIHYNMFIPSNFYSLVHNFMYSHDFRKDILSIIINKRSFDFLETQINTTMINKNYFPIEEMYYRWGEQKLKKRLYELAIDDFKKCSRERLESIVNLLNKERYYKGSMEIIREMIVVRGAIGIYNEERDNDFIKDIDYNNDYEYIEENEGIFNKLECNKEDFDRKEGLNVDEIDKDNHKSIKNKYENSCINNDYKTSDNYITNYSEHLIDNEYKMNNNDFLMSNEYNQNNDQNNGYRRHQDVLNVRSENFKYTYDRTDSNSFYKRSRGSKRQKSYSTLTYIQKLELLKKTIKCRGALEIGNQDLREEFGFILLEAYLQKLWENIDLDSSTCSCCRYINEKVEKRKIRILEILQSKNTYLIPFLKHKFFNSLVPEEWSLYWKYYIFKEKKSISDDRRASNILIHIAYKKQLSLDERIDNLNYSLLTERRERTIKIIEIAKIQREYIKNLKEGNKIYEENKKTEIGINILHLQHHLLKINELFNNFLFPTNELLCLRCMEICKSNDEQTKEHLFKRLLKGNEENTIQKLYEIKECKIEKPLKIIGPLVISQIDSKLNIINMLINFGYKEIEVKEFLIRTLKDKEGHQKTLNVGSKLFNPETKKRIIEELVEYYGDDENIQEIKEYVLKNYGIRSKLRQ